MNNYIKAGLLGLTAITTMNVAVAAEDEHDFMGGDLTGWVEFGNERMFRGNSETQNSEVPSLQGLLTWTHADTGIYAGYWMATNKFDLVPSIYAESGPFVGKFGSAAVGNFGFNYNVFVWHYIYHKSDGMLSTFDPDVKVDVDYQPNYTELWLTANKDVTDDLNVYVEFVPTLDAWFGTKTGRGNPNYGYNTATTLTYQLGNGWSTSANLGYQAFTRPDATATGDWMYGSVGVAKSFNEGWKASLSYHDTNVNKSDDPTKIWESHIVASVSTSF
jgi:uncharacterized protein (TIGR02001 family)